MTGKVLTEKRKPLFRRVWQNRALYLMLMIPLTVLILFRYVPMYGIQIAFKDYMPSDRISESPWVGLRFISRFISNYKFLTIMKNTLVLVSHDMGVHYQITNRMGIMYSGSFVELGKTEDIFSDPIHPYTEMLIGALPRVGDKSQKAGIPGRPPALTNPPPGCRFAPRCPKAKEICHRECPEFVEVRPGRFAACHMLGKEGI